MKNEQQKHFLPDDTPPKKKFVKTANMWCVTKWKDKKQVIEWSVEEPILLTIIIKSDTITL